MLMQPNFHILNPKEKPSDILKTNNCSCNHIFGITCVLSYVYKDIIGNIKQTIAHFVSIIIQNYCFTILGGPVKQMVVFIFRTLLREKR